MNKNFFKKQKGFTLIEMLVSIALFSIVLVIVLGTIVTIVDINRKTRTLTEIINNLNFSLESMNRALKTGRDFQFDQNNNIISTVDQYGRKVCFMYLKNAQAVGRQLPSFSNLNCSSQEADYSALTSSDVKITSFYIQGEGIGINSNQPRVHFLIKGYAEAIRNIKSDFTIQTTVSQRNIDYTGVFNNP